MEGKKVPPSLCCCTAEEEEEEEGGDLISSPSSPLPFPGGIRSGNISSSSSESILPLYCVGGGVSPFPPSHFVTIFSLPSLEWKLMTLSRSPSQSQTEKLSNSKSSNPFFLLYLIPSSSTVASSFFVGDKGWLEIGPVLVTGIFHFLKSSSKKVTHSSPFPLFCAVPN